MPRFFILICIILSIAISLSATVIAQDLQRALEKTENDSTALDIIKQYAQLASDIEDHLAVQRYWNYLDIKGCIEYYDALLKKYPKNEMYIYLRARLMEDSDKVRSIGRTLIKKHPDFEYGYRLLLGEYQQDLYELDPQSEEAKPLLKQFKKDQKYFKQYEKKFPKSEWMLYNLIQRYVWEKDINSANITLAKAVDLNASWLGWQFYTDYYLKTKQFVHLQAYIRRMIDNSRQTKGMTAEEKEKQFWLVYLSTLAMAEYYDEFLDYIAKHPEVYSEPQVLRLHLLVYVAIGDSDKAFGVMDKMIEKPNEYYNWLLTQEQVEPLRQDPRWTSKIAEFKRQWDLGASSRKAKVLANKVNKPAPLWELKDKNGKTIKLADLKGNVVILDFWATWCNPCQKAMPVLDAWMKSKMPAGVKVFSINVWEREPAKAVKLMEDKAYSMTFLYGTENLSQDYGFEGIPFLCVIDKEGNIRFEETGYSEELEEHLIFWTEDLLK